MFSLFLAAIGLLALVNVDEASVIEKNEFYDFSLVALAYRNSGIINAWSLLFVIIRLLRSFSVNRRIFLLAEIIGIAAKDLVAYILLLMPLLVGFVFLTLSIWGNYFIYYRSFGYACLYNILFSIGVGNAAVLSKINLFWTLVFYFLYLFFVMFFILSAFIGIYMDAYRQVRIREGYRDDVKVWNLIDYVIWLFGCFPKSKVKNKIDNLIQNRKSKKEARKKKQIQELTKKQKENEETKEEKSNERGGNRRVTGERKKVTVLLPNES